MEVMAVMEILYGGAGVSVFIGNATHLSSNCDTRLKTYGGASNTKLQSK